ncbi:MAG: restriction endonuclease subunit S, partial [Magnetococcales bacterium]|nr:restriction endonuclease subunit S [Magnetococcales bacterium]
GKICEEGLVFVLPEDIQISRIVWLAEGDIIVVRSGAYTGDSAIISRTYARSIAGFDMVLRCHKANPEFVQFTFLSNYLKEGQIDIVRKRAAQPHLNAEELGLCLIATPPLPEQSAIAAFLDRETGKIDALVAEQEKLIVLLKEKRQALISHAVTKGLNPDAPMKDSGVEWLGKVPEHWGVKRLRHISPGITVGIVVEPSKYYCDEGVPALRSLNIESGKVNRDNLVYISSEANILLNKSRLRAGDLVVVRSGQPGTTAVVPLDLDGCNCIDLIIIRKPENGYEKYLCWYLSSDMATRQFELGSDGAIQKHFNIGMALDLIVPIPPLPEQSAIVAHLDQQTARLDALAAEAQRAIELLKERRSALISAAVTGKIDVRGLGNRGAA